MRLIDADAIEYMEVMFDSFYRTTDEIPVLKWVSKEDINNAPTIDAVQVVRCKDCRWGREVCGNIECSADCNLPPEYHGYEWFCPNGEKRKDGGVNHNGL